MNHGLNFAEKNLIKEVLDQDTLVEHVPRYKTFFEGIQDMKVIQAETGGRGKHTGLTGFTPDKSLLYLGTVPQAVMAAVRELIPDFWERKDCVYWFFKNFPEYDTRTVLK